MTKILCLKAKELTYSIIRLGEVFEESTKSSSSTQEGQLDNHFIDFIGGGGSGENRMGSQQRTVLRFDP